MRSQGLPDPNLSGNEAEGLEVICLDERLSASEERCCSTAQLTYLFKKDTIDLYGALSSVWLYPQVKGSQSHFSTTSNHGSGRMRKSSAVVYFNVLARKSSVGTQNTKISGCHNHNHKFPRVWSRGTNWKDLRLYISPRRHVPGSGFFHPR